ncbi:hypothetical protein Pcinc_040999 [Petrolisthes cinctipes]|uniref:Uncharacterized protein n=1 Tax=Petrolisthes cinctipes TaxID=88211 RepID=A0AAE1BP78_PETCI|nr:hypothetical protein Pcinc_040999 [Petrolisthes cinctipes]
MGAAAGRRRDELDAEEGKTGEEEIEVDVVEEEEVVVVDAVKAILPLTTTTVMPTLAPAAALNAQAGDNGRRALIILPLCSAPFPCFLSPPGRPLPSPSSTFVWSILKFSGILGMSSPVPAAAS